MTGRWRAVVVGLGRVGSRFDEEPGRRAVWSHVGAYLALPAAFELVAACEPEAANAARFRARCPGVPVVADPRELAPYRPDVASICTPAETHARVLGALLERARPRVAWCEKPLAATLAEAAGMVRACEARGVALLVSHVRRWMPLWRRVRALVAVGAVGAVHCVRVAMPNRLYSVQSHAVDLALMVGGEALRVAPLALPELDEEGEPAAAALIAFRGGGYGIIQVTGRRAALIVEAEVIGEEGRLLAREDRGLIAIERFAPSATYAGYRQLAHERLESHPTPTTFSPFVAIAEEAARLAAGAELRPTCGGAEALAVMRLLEAMGAMETPRLAEALT